MPIRPQKNQYRGINAQLTSYLLQEDGGWHSFYSEHIADLRREIDAQLPPGYYARAEKSLQISEHDLLLGLGSRRRTIPDVSVYSTGQGYRTGQPAARPAGWAEAAATPTVTLAVEDTFDLAEEEELSGIVIYQVAEDSESDRPITRLELLSAGNKPPDDAYPLYLSKRRQTLESGVCMVELDYLHEQRSPLLMLPAYPGSFPYLVIVSDPRPSVQAGQTHVYGFQVDDPVPVVEIPLVGEERVVFDFGAVYHQTYLHNRFYGLRAVDYAGLPARFERYQPADQSRIRRRVAAVQQAAAAGLDLEAGPFPVEAP